MTLTSIICDAGPLIHLDELNCLDLLNDFAPIWVPTQVCDEVLIHRPQVFSHKSIDLSQIDVTISRTTVFQTMVRTFSLDHGTIGVLIRSIRRRQRNLHQVVSILESISTHSTLHVRPSFLQSVIDQIEK